MPELKNLEVLEVSLVDRPANKRRFLLMKREGEDAVASEEMLALILESDLENEAEVDEVLKDAPEGSREALKGALKLLNAHRESIDGTLVRSLLTKSGFADEPTQDEDGGKEEDDAILKADGSVDLEKVPEHLRPMIESLWKEQTVAREQVATLKAEIAQRESEAEMKEYLAKAESLHLPAEDDKLALMLRSAKSAMPEYAEFLTNLLERVSNLISVSKALEEAGTTGASNTAGSAYERAEQMAKDMVEKSEGAISFEAALDKVFKDNRDLANEYVKEGK